MDSRMFNEIKTIYWGLIHHCHRLVITVLIQTCFVNGYSSFILDLRPDLLLTGFLIKEFKIFIKNQYHGDFWPEKVH